MVRAVVIVGAYAIAAGVTAAAYTWGAWKRLEEALL